MMAVTLSEIFMILKFSLRPTVRNRLYSCAILFSLLSPATGYSFADETTSALINQALDKPTKLKLNSLLPQAMEQIQQQTGVPMKADPEVWALLPWGKETSLTATIDNQSLRQALEAITRKLALQFELRNDVLYIEPIPALRRLAHRSTAQELACLEILSREAATANGTLTLKALLDSVDAQLQAAKHPYVIDRPTGDQIPMNAEVNVPRNATMLEALEAIHKQTSATWYPWGKSIVILSKQDEIKRQLARTITVRYTGSDLAQVLSDLSHKSGVSFTMEAGALQQMPPESRAINLVLDDYSVHDALEAIRATSGLEFMIRESGVYFWNQASSPSRKDRVMINMPIRGTEMNVYITESQVPPDLREYINQKMQKQFGDIRQMMKEEGFKPSTQPSTQPATAKKGNEL